MKIKLFRDDVKLPCKAHETDCGLDLFIPDAFDIEPFETICLGLGIGFRIPEGHSGIFVPRSSMAKKGLIITPAVVDYGYNGECHLILTNCSNNSFHFDKNDRVCSLVCFNTINPIIEVVEEFEKTDRNDAGLGSTGK